MKPSRMTSEIKRLEHQLQEARAARADHILALRDAGVTWQDIAELHRLSRQGVMLIARKRREELHDV